MLDLCSNRIAVVSPTVAQVVSLTSLDLTNNRLAAVPREFCGLSNLDTLRSGKRWLKMGQWLVVGVCRGQPKMGAGVDARHVGSCALVRL